MSLGKTLDQDTLSAIAQLFIVMYAHQLAPKLPESVLRLVEMDIVKAGVLAAVVYNYTHNRNVSVIVAVMSLVVGHLANQQAISA